LKAFFFDKLQFLPQFSVLRGASDDESFVKQTFFPESSAHSGNELQLHILWGETAV